MNIKQIVKEIFSNIKKDWYLPVTEYQVYSEQEQVVGVWTDGKPLYRKVVYSTTSKTGWSVAYTEPEAEMLRVVVCEVNLDNSWHPATYQTTTSRLCVSVSGNTVKYDMSAFPVGRPVRLIIEYTKTTDTTTTKKVPFEPLVEYSTDEKMIGYWIDGKPLYRKTVTTVVVNGSISGTSIENIEHCKSIQWSFKNTNNHGVTGSPTYNGANMYYDYPNLIIRGEGFAAWAINQVVHIIIEYTKTTDQGGS